MLYVNMTLLRGSTPHKISTSKPYLALCRAVQDGVLLPELQNFMQYYTRHDMHIVHVLSTCTCCLHVVHTCMLSACHLHLHVICMSSGHIICTCMSSTHAHVIHTSSAALLMVSMDLNYLSTLTGTGY